LRRGGRRFKEAFLTSLIFFAAPSAVSASWAFVSIDACACCRKERREGEGEDLDSVSHDLMQ
jgi:hypothetical protein